MLSIPPTVLKALPRATIAVLLCLILFPTTSVGQSPSSASGAAPVSGSPAEKAADVLANSQRLYRQTGPKEALPEFERALALFQKDSDKKNEAITIGFIGNCYKRFGDFPKAEEFLQRALSMKRALGDRLEEGRTLSHLGLLHWQMGEYKKALDYYEQAIAIGQRLGDRVLQAAARNNRGLVLEELGDYRRAIEEFNQALD